MLSRDSINYGMDVGNDAHYDGVSLSFKPETVMSVIADHSMPNVVLNDSPETIIQAIFKKSRGFEGGDNHERELDPLVQAMSERIMNTMTMVQSVINPTAREIFKAIEERRKEEAPLGMVSKVRTVKLPEIYLNESVSRILEMNAQGGDVTYVDEKQAFALIENLSSEDFLKVMKPGLSSIDSAFDGMYTGKDGEDRLTEVMLSAPRLLSSQSQHSIDPADLVTKTTAICMTFFIDGVINDRHPSVSYGDLLPNDKNALVSLKGLFALRAKEACAMVEKLSQDKEAVFLRMGDDFVVLASAMKSLRDKGLEPEALAEAFALRYNTQSRISENIDQLNAALEKRLKSGEFEMKARLEQIIRQWLRVEITTFISEGANGAVEQDDIAETLQVVRNFLTEKPYVTGADIRMYICECLSKALADDSNAYEFLCEMDSYLKEMKGTDTQTAAAVAKISLIVKTVASVITAKKFG